MDNIIDVLADGMEQGSVSYSGNVDDSRMVRSIGYLPFLGDDDGKITVSATATTGKTILVSFLGYDSDTTVTPLFAWYWYSLPHVFDISSYPNVKFFRLVLIYTGYGTLPLNEVASCTITYNCSWKMEGDYPVPIQSIQAVTDGFTKPYPASLWRIDESNDGYPYNELMPDILYYEPPQPVHIKPVKQKPYITVYSYRTPQDGFDNHGLYILTPTRCTIVEALNGRYELSIEHPIDPEGRWEYIRENNIIKALGQLFTIRSVTQKWQGRSGKITAKADHIFYQLSDWWIERGNEDIAARTVTGLISLAVSKTVKHISPGQTAYTYHYDSDMTVPDVLGDNKWEWLKEGMTPIDFVMGSNGVLEACGGRLHRDNFRFSIYERKEGSKDNAFEIRVGKNLTGISRTIDASSLITYLKAWDNYGNWFAVSWVGSEDIGMPHYTVREKDFSYSLKDLYYRDERAVAAQMLAQDALDYFNANCAPLISYDIDLVDIKNNPEYEDLQITDEFKVGNRGYIYDERIGGKVLIEITETTTDAMTGEVTNVLFGSKRSFMNPWNKTAIIDIEVEPEEIGFVVTDAEGAFVYDSEGSRIVEYEGV